MTGCGLIAVYRGLNIKLLICFVSLVATVTWITIFWNYNFKGEITRNINRFHRKNEIFNISFQIETAGFKNVFQHPAANINSRTATVSTKIPKIITETFTVSKHMESSEKEAIEGLSTRTTKVYKGAKTENIVGVETKTIESNKGAKNEGTVLLKTQTTQRYKNEKYKNIEGLNTQTTKGTKVNKTQDSEGLSPQTTTGHKKDTAHDSVKVQYQRPCKLDWSLPYINLTHYEKIGPQIPKTTPMTKNLEAGPIFKDPTISLHPDRFLYPAGRWGPNNQVFGFFEAIFVAVMLNRTLVLPRFTKHHRDKQRYSTDFVSPTHRVDVESYCTFVSCITLGDFQQRCGFQIDAILNTKYLKMKDVRSIEQSTGMRILPEKSKDISGLSKILLPSNGTSKSNPELNFTPDELKVFFKSSARCVIYPYPILDLRTHDWKGNRVNLQGGHKMRQYYKDRPAPAGSKLFWRIVEHYKRPAYVRKITNDFIHNLTNGEPFLSIHWRYNEGDFLSKIHCTNKEINGRICSQARSFTVEKFAKKIEEQMNLMKDKGFNITHIYFASPQDMLPTIDKLSKLLSEKQGWKTHCSRELSYFMKTKYSGCDFLSTHFDDIISTTEMEICSRGFAFLGSQGTTWTGNVMKTRVFGNITGIRPEFDDWIFSTK